MEKAYWKIIIFHEGKRVEKSVADKRKLVETYKALRDKGVKVAIVSKVKAYWPTSDDEGPDDPGMFWCPYCRRWRWFAIPDIRRTNGDVVPMSEEYWDDKYRRVLNSMRVPWCQWCHISLQDFHVKQMNDMWGWSPRKARRRRTRR